MKLEKITDSSLCCGCGACVKACAKKAIEMQENRYGFKYPKINLDECVDCGACRKVCPVNNKNERKEKIDVYAARGKDLSEVANSASGGIFSLLAKECLNRQGIVFGVVMDSDFVVKHVATSDIEGIQQFKGSKYVQSELGETYQEIRALLNQNKNVLFSGTPCQVNGLKNFLGKEYPTLITVDFICHGVPSPLVFREYIKWKQDEFSEPIKTMKFRDKRQGWSNYCVTISDGKEEKSEIFYKNFYMYGFLHNIYLRESCHNCMYKGSFSKSDITLADYWGAKGKLVDEFFENGLSLVFTNSAKGKEYFEVIKTEIDFEEKTKDEVLKIHNKHYEESSQPSKCRGKFWTMFEEKGIEFAMRRYCQDPYYMRVYYACRRSLKKIIRYRGK